MLDKCSLINLFFFLFYQEAFEVQPSELGIPRASFEFAHHDRSALLHMNVGHLLADSSALVFVSRAENSEFS